MKLSDNTLPLAIGALALAILTTGTAAASTGALVNIVDPVTKSPVRVDGGKIRVGDGSGALTVDGTLRVNDGSGPLTVDGTVGLRAPATSFNSFREATDTVPARIYDISPGQGLAITGITVAHLNGTGADKVTINVLQATASGCGAADGPVDSNVVTITVPQNDTRSVTFSTPLLIPKRATSQTCLTGRIYEATTGATVDISVTGYLY